MVRALVLILALAAGIVGNGLPSAHANCSDQNCNGPVKDR